ncbi:MAG: SNF2-related protein [bacterium]|nr:SNF2-related protein [bacterium]
MRPLFSKRQTLEFLATLEDTRQKAAVIKQWLDLARQGKADFTESDVADFLRAEATARYEADKVLLGGRPGSAELIRHFYATPTYLARAFVPLYPDIFYVEGYAHYFVLKLRADLGPVLQRPTRALGEESMAVFMESVPQAVQADLAALDRERRFREYLPDFSRDPSFAFELLEEVTGKTTDRYAKTALQELHRYCQHLLRMAFPDFVDHIRESVNGSVREFPFPSFHVRWWIDSATNVNRVLNMGDTGAQKTAFAVVAAHHFGCRKILVLCPPHAKDHWVREIIRYFRSACERTYVLRHRSHAREIALSPAQYTIVGYTAITDPQVLEVLKNVPFDALVWDECHYAKSVGGGAASQRALASAELVKALPLQRVLALSATPLENHPGELAAIATVLRPDLFQDAKTLYRTRSFDPRLLRELFREHVLEVELREVVDLPEIQPKPWEDLFGIVPLPMNEAHRAVYEFVREDDQVPLESAAKVRRLLLAAMHPHRLERLYAWPAELRAQFRDPALSTKLLWIKERVTRELKEGAKVVIATGIYVDGITKPQDDKDQGWVGKQLREWFPDTEVLILYGETSPTTNRHGASQRDRIIARWRSDPNARILLVSTRTCPDAINLSVPALPGVTKLFLTTLSFPWVPWKQFLGRFWRSGLGVPVSYAVPVLRSTVDESLAVLLQRKWELQQLFRACVPLTKRELDLFDRGKITGLLVPDTRTSAQTVNFIGKVVRECDEEEAQAFLCGEEGAVTPGERFARAFINIHEHSAPGHIARFMKQVIRELVRSDVVELNGILDAGCGPLTLERALDYPVFGVDMNESILRLGREQSVHDGANARVGFLTRLPDEWKHKFDLTVASLVLHWASSHRRTKAGVSIRKAVLQELVRVTHKMGRVWLTLTHRAMDSALFKEWCSVLERNEFQLVRELTGLVEAVDHGDFAFWSLCFCPEEKLLTRVEDGDLALAFERSRVVTKRGKGKRKEEQASEPPESANRVKHEQFVVNQLDGKRASAVHAAQAAAAAEQERIARLAGVPWRSLVKMERRRRS